MKLLKGTPVLIKKPTLSQKLQKTDVFWDNAMDKYVGQIDYIKTISNERNNTYKLKYIGYRWHRDWLIVGNKDKNGKFMPLNNEGLSRCYWCNVPTKLSKEKYAHGVLTFVYCPKCGR